MDLLFSKLLCLGTAASWLILAVLFLRFFFQHAPRWIVCLLWALVAFRLLCPLPLTCSLSLLPAAAPVQEIFFAAPSKPRLSLPLASLIWSAGVLALLGSACVRYFRIRRKTAASLPLRDNLHLCDNAAMPFILGMIEPQIYLPSDLPKEHLNYVLAHEQAHIRRRDHWWKPLGFLLLSIYWFQPLCWLAYALFCRDLELACDEKVIRTFDLAKRKEYSRALLFYSMPQKTAVTSPLAFGELGVTQRIQAVLSYEKSPLPLVFSALAISFVTALCFLTTPAGNPVYTTAPTRVPPKREAGVFLELIAKEESAPSYSLTFQKTDGRTGAILPITKDGGTGSGPLITVEPGGFTEITCWNDGSDSFRKVELVIPKPAKASSVTVRVNDLTYTTKLEP